MANRWLIVLAFFIVSAYLAQGLRQDCPLSSKMTICSPKCKDDTECFGQKCCPNICNTKSCTSANQLSSANNNKYKGSSSGATGSYCGNVKCNSFETCKMDPATKRMKCVRA